MRSLLLVALAVLAAPAAPAQVDCNADPVLVDTQEKADLFGCVTVPNNLTITGSVTSLAGLSELTAVGGDLKVKDAPLLPSLAGLEGLDSIGGRLRIEGDNDLLTEVTALSGLQSLGQLYLFDTSALTRPPTLSGLTSTGSIQIVAVGSAFASLDGLETIESVGGSFSINSAFGLTDITGLSGLQSVGSGLTLLRVASLTSLDGLQNLRTIASTFDLRLNGSLTNVDALADVESVGGLGFFLQGNPSLERCSVGLGPVLTSGGANGSFISDNDPEGDCNSDDDVLAAFNALPGEGDLTGALAYGTCPEPPAALAAGRQRCRVQASGTLSANHGQRYTVFLRLTDGAGFSRIAFRGEIKPQAGQSVSQSIAFTTKGTDPATTLTLELVAEAGSVAAPGGAAVVLGSVTMQKAGASLAAAERLSVFPNPAAEAATLRFAVAEAGRASLVIYDALGREVARPVDGAVSGLVEATVDASGLPAGVYMARLVTAGAVQTARLSVVR